MMQASAHFRLLGKKSNWLAETISQIYACAEHFQKLTVLCPDSERLNEIDEVLWQNSVHKFVTFALSDESESSEAKVLLTKELNSNTRRPALINLGGDIPSDLLTMQYLCEIVFCDEDSVAKARGQYKMYHQHGYQLEHHELTNSN